MSSSTSIVIRTSLSIMALAISQLSFAQVVEAPVAAPLATQTQSVTYNEGDLNKTIPMDDQLTHGQLSNGVKYYILPNTTPVKKAELRLVVQAGSLNEEDKESGMAHFTEHMVFNGTKNFPKREMIDTLEEMGVRFGADLNAYTGFNETVYVLPIPLENPKNLSTAMQVLEDWAFNATMDTKEINKERPVIVEEWRGSSLSPQARQQAKMVETLAKGSKYSKRDPIGDVENVKTFAPEALRDFYQRWYRPNLMSVIVVGDVDPKATKKLVEQHFADYKNPPQPVTAPAITVPNNVEPIVGVYQSDEVSQNIIMMAYKDMNNVTIDKTDGDYVKNLREMLISQMINQRFTALLDSGKQPFIGAQSTRDELGGFIRSKKAYTLMAIAASGQQADALQALHIESRRIIEHGFSADELEQAKSNMFANIEDYYLNRRKVESAEKAEEYIRGVTENEPLPTIPWEYEAQKKYLPTITIAQINQLAKQHFRPENRIVFVTSNDKNNALTVERIKQIISTAPAVEPLKAMARAAALLPKLPVAGRVTKSEEDPLTGVVTWTLSNGVKVSYKQNDYNDNQIRVNAFSDGGYSLLTDQEWRQSQWAIPGLEDAGYNGLTKTQVAQLLAGKTINIGYDIDETSHGLQGQFAPRDSESAFQLMYSLITGLNKNINVFSTFKERSIAATANADKNRESYFVNQVQLDLNRKNPRFTGIYPTAQAWEQTNYDVAYNSFKKIYSNANGMHFSFFGKIDPQELRRYSELYLASLPSQMSVMPQYKERPYPLDFTQRAITVKKGKDNVSEVRIMYGGQAEFDPRDNLSLIMAGDILTERLIKELREELGGVYSPGASGGLIDRPNPSYRFDIAFPCDPARVDELTKTTLSIVQNLIEEGPTQAELEKVRQGFLANFRQSKNTNEFGAEQFSNALKNGHDPASDRTYEKRLAAISVDDIQSTVSKFLSADKRVTATLMPE